MKFNLRKIMLKAWELYRRGGLIFSETLHRAWESNKAEPVNAERIAAAKTDVGITEDTNTWAGWERLDYKVIHGSKALFGCDLIYASKGDDVIYKARFFGASQVQAIA